MNSETTYDTNAKAFLKKWNVRFSVHFVDNSCPPFAWRFKSSEHYAFCTNPNDARLIAAAPDLLEACKVVVASIERNTPALPNLPGLRTMLDGLQRQCQRAIDKTTVK